MPFSSKYLYYTLIIIFSIKISRSRYRLEVDYLFSITNIYWQTAWKGKFADSRSLVYGLLKFDITVVHFATELY